jgi:hypothetical protein
MQLLAWNNRAHSVNSSKENDVLSAREDIPPYYGTGILGAHHWTLNN